MSGRRRDLGPGNRFAVLAARVRIPLIVAGVLLLLLSVTVEPRVWPVAAVLLALGYLLYLRLGTVRTDPVPVRPPVAGRWVPVNSPGSKVPSHGLHAYGQTYGSISSTCGRAAGRSSSAGRRSPGRRGTSPRTASRSSPPPTRP